MARTRAKTLPTARQILDASESETGYQTTVLEYLAVRGWLVNHNYDSRKSGPDKGFPDLCCVRDGRVVFVELKKTTGRESDAQKRWREAIQAGSDAEAYVIRPGDWEWFREAML